MAGKTALITGVTGQDGAYLAQLLLDKGYVVHGLKRRSSSFNTGRIDHIYPRPHDPETRFHLHFGDMTDASNLVRVVKETMPDEVYNLAAQSHVRVSFETPEYTADADALGTTRLLEALRVLDLTAHTRFYQASTSELFGNATTWPQNEDTPFRPQSPYATAKLYAYWMTVNYRDAYGLYGCNGILFNHASPLRGETFVTRKITRGVADMEHGRADCLYLGNLEAERDWGHARDFARGMWMMLQQPEPDDYVLATGESHSVREFVEAAFRVVGRDIEWRGTGLAEQGLDRRTGAVVVRIDPYYHRPNEVDRQQGDYAKAARLLGWRPTVGFEELVQEMTEADLAAAASPARGSVGAVHPAGGDDAVGE